MVITPNPRKRNQSHLWGSMTTELVIALGLLTATLIPLGAAVWREQRLCQAYYYRAIAMEIVDGEMEVLRAGAWREFESGTQPYAVRAESARNLPDGTFTLTVDAGVIRLEWLPRAKHHGGKVARQFERP